VADTSYTHHLLWTALGILMNTRSLMELVILNIGLDLRVISPALFSMMVLMALITTFMTTPLLQWIRLPRDEESYGRVVTAQNRGSGGPPGPVLQRNQSIAAERPAGVLLRARHRVDGRIVGH
jgi:hypothetical protein